MGYMEGLTLSDVIESTRGHWTGQGDPTAIVPTGVSIDTRTLKPGEIFFALPGEKVDGHQFLDAAFDRGACAAVVTRSGVRESRQLIAVDAPDLALGDLARFYRRRFDIPVIGITGSSGKTTTKDMVAAVLSTRYRVLATQGNLNNRLGVPLTLFNLSAHCDVAVIEMGITERGGMRYLCEIAQPTIGMITNIGPAHIEFFGSVEGVAKAKGELLEYLDESSMTILNLDDLFLSKERAKVKGRLLGIGIEQICQFRGEGLKLDQKGFGHFSLQGHSFHLSIPGKHNVYNALMAATAGRALNVPLQDTAKAQCV
jgi:UDP-N-acetylmuramoyl-tripeptide--D-alanyl-D-alanine ligase